MLSLAGDRTRDVGGCLSTGGVFGVIQGCGWTDVEVLSILGSIWCSAMQAWVGKPPAAPSGGDATTDPVGFSPMALVVAQGVPVPTPWGCRVGEPSRHRPLHVVAVAPGAELEQ
ncbi:hypothetical protein Sjap_010466 [Stephania japonica]|uniref:Uncharacterized protein n=1 Tax=Stephania japonica TaxID=461633 RepID=A0AAP0J9M6_9MAGN